MYELITQELRAWPNLKITKIVYPERVKPGDRIKIIVHVQNVGASGAGFARAFNETQNIKCGGWGGSTWIKSGQTKEIDLYPYCHARKVEGKERIRIEAYHIERGGKVVIDDIKHITVTVAKEKPPVKVKLIDLKYPSNVVIKQKFTVSFKVKNVGGFGDVAIDLEPGPRWVVRMSPGQEFSKSWTFKAAKVGTQKFELKAFSDTHVHFRKIFYVHVVECREGETKCVGYDLYKCIKGKWQLIQKNAEECGYAAPAIPPPEKPEIPIFVYGLLGAGAVAFIMYLIRRR